MSDNIQEATNQQKEPSDIKIKANSGIDKVATNKHFRIVV